MITSNEQMLISAVRYALGRRSYIVKDTCDYLEHYMDYLSSQCKAVMIRDIEEQHTLGYGDECDKARWLKLLRELKRGYDGRTEVESGQGEIQTNPSSDGDN